MDLQIAGLQLKTGYFGDRQAFLALADLLQDTFDIDIRLLDRLGGPNASSMPFGYFDADDRCVANFSAFSMPLIINGRTVSAVGYQSGAVRPEYRGQGLYRDLMRRAFAWAETQDFELGILLTDKPALYEPYDFRIIQQHAFHGEPAWATAPVEPARPLSLDNPDDVDLVQRLVAGRQPVSTMFAVEGRGIEFLLNAYFDSDIRLSHLGSHNAVVAWKHVDGRLHLLDVVAECMPPLSVILAALAVETSGLTVCFTPDRLEWPDGQPVTYQGICELMVCSMRATGFSPVEGMISPLSEF
jgi:predicted N-acetyltransferase YhbS